MTRAIIRTLGYGEMRFELFPDKAPITVASFAEAANAGFYDGLAWCRVVRGYVIQAGSPDNDIMTDSDFHITGEFRDNGFDTGLTHARGAISMARDDDYNTAGTQFFVVHRDAHKLDGRYAAFGRMIGGFEALDRIAEVETNGTENWNRPLKLPIIESIRVEADEPLPPVTRLP
ncbi:peptidylprolyl isomerase [Bacillota bacterium Meth-B3]